MKRRIHTNIVIQCGDLEIAIGEMYNVLFMNEPMALRQVGYTGFLEEIYNAFCGPIALRSEVIKVCGHVMTRCQISNK